MRIYTAVNVLGGGDIPCLHHLAPPFYAARLLLSPTHAAPPFIVKFDLSGTLCMNTFGVATTRSVCMSP